MCWRATAQLGVAQTPYLAFPNSAEPVERIAGATTDIQYLVHQGATFFNASYWVGANALIRFEALQDIRREQVDGGKTCQVFIQDETVIEDTGSTIDLLNAGWSVHNFFSPLAYSATPGDFGALAIQRKRWSNGGLIIFPMLLAQYFGSSGRLRRLPEVVLRSHYLLSPLIGNAAVFTLMVWASQDGRALVWTPLRDDPVLPALRHRSRATWLSLARPVRGLRAQPDAAADQLRRYRRVDPPDGHGPQGQFLPHPESG